MTTARWEQRRGDGAAAAAVIVAATTTAAGRNACEVGMLVMMVGRSVFIEIEEQHHDAMKVTRGRYRGD